MNNVINRIKNISYLDEKRRFLVFVLGLFLILFLAVYLFRIAYARYEINAKINANIDKALYIFESDRISFNLDPTGIIPSDDDYTYRFSVSNFNTSKQSDVDLSYKVKVRTTTNLPIGVKLYRNELPTASGATNLFNGVVTAQDEDDAWYRIYESNQEFQFLYENRTTDVYTLVINFPTAYKNNTDYANYLESIEVILESKQII